MSHASLNEGPCWFPQSCPLGLGDEREGGELHPPTPSLEMGVIWAGLRTSRMGCFQGWLFIIQVNTKLPRPFPESSMG